jgi:hypothetical protein
VSGRFATHIMIVQELTAPSSTVATLQKDYQAEIRLSKEAAIKRATGPAVTPAPSTAESAKDTLLIKLYEDLTNLSVPIIKTKEGGSGLEVTFVCVQTVDERSEYLFDSAFRKA